MSEKKYSMLDRSTIRKNPRPTRFPKRKTPALLPSHNSSTKAPSRRQRRKQAPKRSRHASDVTQYHNYRRIISRLFITQTLASTWQRSQSENCGPRCWTVAALWSPATQGTKWRLVRIADGPGIEQTSAQNPCAPIASTADSYTRPASSALSPTCIACGGAQKTDFAAVDTNVARPSGEEIPHHISPRRRRTFASTRLLFLR
ncbi:hypothetical protein HPB51_013336 [Rhipicephalus microplus]|uniref:Uncharacterized protein n=1 Tax=Rhipicephalus microplus TaxID=6941 RepID=A0A9J6ETF7_RHIMP|nr:hypothetical protein HPB51_013336 [Rhipicephalus microplus]